jgi:hypothetical protein
LVVVAGAAVDVVVDVAVDVALVVDGVVEGSVDDVVVAVVVTSAGAGACVLDVVPRSCSSSRPARGADRRRRR